MTDAETQEQIGRMINSTADQLTAYRNLTTVTEGVRSEIFKAADAPAFKEMKDFPQYYTSLRFFMNGTRVSSDRCREACFLILSRWQGSLLHYAQEVDAGDLARDDWVQTKTQVLDWLNTRFRNKTDLADASARWVGTSQRFSRRKWDDANEFYLSFESELNDFRAACLRAGRSAPTEDDITRQFVASLPPAIAARCRETASDLDTRAYSTYRDKLAILWESHKTAHIKINEVRVNQMKRPWDETEEEEEAVRPVKRPYFPLPCQLKKKFDEKPVVPMNLRGTIGYVEGNTSEENAHAKARRDRCARAEVCARNTCRRPRSEHPAMEHFQKIGPWNGPSPRIREIREEDEYLQEEIRQEQED